MMVASEVSDCESCCMIGDWNNYLKFKYLGYNLGVKVMDILSIVGKLRVCRIVNLVRERGIVHNVSECHGFVREHGCRSSLRDDA